MKRLHTWLVNENNTTKDIYIWSTLGSIAIAASSFLLLVAVSRCIGTYEAGIFSIAFALAQQLICIGYFEVRVYQATDLHNTYHFSDYLGLRFLSCGIMIFTSILFALRYIDDAYKMTIIGLVCFLKCLDAFADVYETMFQQHERLDITGKSLFLRTSLYTIFFVLTMMLFNDLQISLIVAIGVSILCIIISNLNIQKLFIPKLHRVKLSNLYSLFLTCLPLFISSFLIMYIINSPKYVIDAYMPSDYQTYFSIIFFPASVINLISGFLFKPLLTSIAILFKDQKIDELKKMVVKLCFIMILLACVVLLGAYFLGIPVLSILYGLDLSAYKSELMIVICGGSIYALSIIFYYIMVTARAQTIILITYTITCIAAYILSPVLVSSYAFLGAAYSYLLLMLILFITSLIAVLFLFKKSYT